MIQHAPARIVALNGPCHRVHPGHAQYLLVRGLGGGRFKRWPAKKWLPFTRRATRWNKPTWDASGRRHRPVAVIKRVQTFESADYGFFVPDFGHIEPLEPLVLPCESRQIHRPASSHSGIERYAIRPGSRISMILMFPLRPFYQP